MALRLFIPLLLAALIAGCVSRRGPEFDPRDPNDPTVMKEVVITNALKAEWLSPPTAEFRLGPGDKIEIELIGVSEPPTETMVGPDGRIYFHLLPGVNVWGLTINEACAKLEKDLTQYVKHPHVAITLREVKSQRIWVLGRLTRPGIYPLDRPLTVVEAISMAGGLNTSMFTGTTEELGDLTHSFLMRHGEVVPVNFKSLIHDGDMSQNIYLQPDDFVYIPSAQSAEVYVLGAVTEPRAVSFKDQVTLSSAIANARGALPEARLHEVIIVRGALTQPHCATVDYYDIVKGKVPDIRLQPRDIVYVPDRPFGILENAGNLIINSFVRTVAANEGVRAGGGSTTIGVGVNVNQ